jgi:hypothetical protein
MAADELTVIDLADVPVIECQCKSCGTALVFAPEKWQPRERDCPGCDKTWWRSKDEVLNAVQQLANAWRVLRRIEKGEVPDVRSQVKLRLHIPRRSR